MTADEQNTDLSKFEKIFDSNVSAWVEAGHEGEWVLLADGHDPQFFASPSGAYTRTVKLGLESGQFMIRSVSEGDQSGTLQRVVLGNPKIG